MTIGLLVYYVFCSSVVFTCGIGLKHAVMKSSSMHYFVVFGLKTLCTVLFSLVPVWGVSVFLFGTAGYMELFPLILVGIVLLASRVVDMIFHLFSGQVSTGVLLPLAILFFALSESQTVGDAFYIALAVIFSIFSLMPVLYAIRKRLILLMPPRDFKMSIVIFFSAAFLFFALYAWHISWFNQEVLK